MGRFAHATYCDDIRHELGGKLTLVGVYSSTLLVPSFPVVLPKLCMVLSIVTPAERPFQSLKLQVFNDEAVLAEGDLSTEDLGLPATTHTPADDAANEGAELRIEFAAHFVFSPLKLEGPGRIRVRVNTEDGEIKANSLRVAQLEVQG